MSTVQEIYVYFVKIEFITQKMSDKNRTKLLKKSDNYGKITHIVRLDRCLRKKFTEKGDLNDK